jgi:hypothetical protein
VTVHPLQLLTQMIRERLLMKKERKLYSTAGSMLGDSVTHLMSRTQTLEDYINSYLVRLLRGLCICI